MTREKASNIWQIIKAYGEGAIVEVYSEHYGKWIEPPEPLFKEGEKYRIKPEENYTIEQNTGENRVEGGILSVSGSVLEKHTCKECVGETVSNITGGKLYCKNRNCDLPACDNFKSKFKPKKEKHYRPFKDCDELMHITGTKLLWVIMKDSHEEFLITGYDWECREVKVNGEWITLKTLFNNCEFGNHSPCGVEE